MFVELSWFLICLHLIGATGFVVVVSLGLVTAPIRKLWVRIFRRYPLWSKMISCPMCFGVWGGAGWAILLTFRTSHPTIAHLHDVLAFTFSVSLLGFLVALCDHVVGQIGKERTDGRSRQPLLRAPRGRNGS